MSSPSVQPQNDDESANSVPDDLPEASQIDSLIATQMSRLSTNEREKAYFDIHGISGEIEESPEMIGKHGRIGEGNLKNKKQGGLPEGGITRSMVCTESCV